MFIDRAEIFIKAGRGGHGCVSFCRERFRPKGGPDGGKGGDGGSVFAVATPGVDTLLDFSGRYHWPAEDGRNGEGKDRAGKAGRDLDLLLPLGTLIFDRETGILIKDLDEPGVRVCLAIGGVGGKGNKAFATPTHQTPREYESGQPGQERWLKLDLKLMADVGVVGMPNAGKSTLLSCLSRARPKIAAYPFTTLKPQLGIVELSGFRRMVFADIPGLIEGAHAGAGLGDEFLRHIERTRVLLHVIDAAPTQGAPSPVDAYRVVRSEIAQFSPRLAEKPEIVVANKSDLPESDAGLALLRQEIDREIIAISAATRQGLESLTNRVWTMVEQTRSAATDDETIRTATAVTRNEP